MLLTAKRADGQVCKRIFPEGCVEGENKGYSRDYEAQWPPMRGRIRVRLFNADGKPTNPDITTRKQLFLKVAELIPRMPSRQAGYVDPQQVRRHAPKPARGRHSPKPARTQTHRQGSARTVAQACVAVELSVALSTALAVCCLADPLPMPVHRLALARSPRRGRNRSMAGSGESEAKITVFYARRPPQWGQQRPKSQAPSRRIRAGRTRRKRARKSDWKGARKSDGSNAQRVFSNARIPGGRPCRGATQSGIVVEYT